MTAFASTKVRVKLYRVGVEVSVMSALSERPNDPLTSFTVISHAPLPLSQTELVTVVPAAAIKA
jgi:hypothetical protein